MSARPLLALRFNAEIERLWRQVGCPERLAVAVSGGADSMALLCLLHGWGKVELCALTVDHGLRKEAAAEAEMVGKWAAEQGVEHHILKIEQGLVGHVSQEKARDFRYGLLMDFCAAEGIENICLGHHANDQAETVLMRGLKSNSLASMRGMKPLQHKGGIGVLRALLGVDKMEILAFCAVEKIPFCEDMSNKNLAFLRPSFRFLWEELAVEGLDLKALGRISAAARALDLALENEMDLLAESYLRVEKEGYAWLDERAINERKPRIMAQFLGKIAVMIGGGRYLPKGEAMAHLAAQIFEGKKTVTLGNAAFMYKAKKKAWLIVREARNFGEHFKGDFGGDSGVVRGDKVWDRRFKVVFGGDKMKNWEIMSWSDFKKLKKEGLTADSASYAKKYAHIVRQGFPLLISPEGVAILPFKGVAEYDKMAVEIKFMPEKYFLPIVK